MASIFVHLALAAYALGAAAHLADLAGHRKGSAKADGQAGHGKKAAWRWGEGALAVGFFLHGGAVLSRLPALWEGASFRFGEGLSLVAFFMMALYLLMGRLYRGPSLGAFVAPLVVAVLLPAHALPNPEGSLPGWAGAIRPLHIGAAVTGLSLFALGFVVSVMYLLLERELKAKKLGAMFRRLPPLALLDRMTHGLVIGGFALLSFTIVTGSFFSMAEYQTLFALRSKETLALGAWTLCAVVLLLRQIVGWRGRRVAFATMVGFVLMSIAYVGSFVGRPI